jgi:membrane-bound lytic murein transglycosylase B
MRRAAALLALLALAGCGGSSRHASPAPSATPPAKATAAPAGPAGPAARLEALHATLARAIDDWRAHGRPADDPAPAAVAGPAREQQALYRHLAAHPRQARAVVGRLRGPVAAEARDVLAAERALRVLNAPFRKAQRRVELGPPEPAGRLLGYYREAHARSGVAVPLLAAVNLVESAFGRLRNDSTAGAQGPMQFIRATWASYGNGGDVHDPHDAILGAGRFLHAAGAPGDERSALLRYNPSPLYVTAVSAYARLMRRDPRAYYALYAWPAPVP